LAWYMLQQLRAYSLSGFVFRPVVQRSSYILRYILSTTNHDDDRNGDNDIAHVVSYYDAYHRIRVFLSLRSVHSRWLSVITIIVVIVCYIPCDLSAPLRPRVRASRAVATIYHARRRRRRIHTSRCTHIYYIQ